MGIKRTFNNNHNRCNGLKYEKESFESHYNNNCYTYAINQPKNPYTSEAYMDYGYCQPGNLGGKDKRDKFFKNYTYDNYMKYVKKDLKSIGFELIPSSVDKYVEDESAWKIAFCYKNDADYHFYRQNDDGTWSHKKGSGDVCNVDHSGNTIYNPEFCDRGRYETFGGFFIIRPIKIKGAKQNVH